MILVFCPHVSNGFPKNKNFGCVGGVSSIQFYFGFLEFFNFAKPLNTHPEQTYDAWMGLLTKPWYAVQMLSSIVEHIAMYRITYDSLWDATNIRRIVQDWL